MYRVRCVHTGLPGSPFLSTFYFSEGEDADAASMVNRVKTFWEASKGQRVSGLVTTILGQVDQLSESTGDLTGGLVTTDQTSTSSGPGAGHPPATQGLLRLTTGVVVGTRRLKGHLFLPAPLSAGGANGPSSSIQSVYTTAAGVLGAEAPGAPDWVVWSRKYGQIHPVTGSNVWSQWAVLRSRRD